MNSDSCRLKVEPLFAGFGAQVALAADSRLPDEAEVADLFATHGAVLFRGYPFTLDSFSDFTESLCGRWSSYLGGGFRFRGLDRVAYDKSGTLMSTTGSTQSFGIPLHGEMYYQEDRPDVIFFFCKSAPSQQGQTTLADGCAVFAELAPATRTFFGSEELLYVRDLEKADWEVAFRTADVAVLRDICARNRMTVTIDDGLGAHIEYATSGLKVVDGRTAFINNALMLWPFEGRSGVAPGD